MQELRVEARHARRISQACRDLSQTAAAVVDTELASKAGCGLPWPRLSKILAAAVINADPALHQAKLAAAKFDRRVWLSESEHGLRNLLIRADQGDQILLYALIERIADILKLDGDTDPVDQRRSKAAGWLARPEDLVVLLYQHRNDGHPQAGAGSGSASEPGDDRPSSEEASAASPSAEPASRDDSGHNSGPNRPDGADPDTEQHDLAIPPDSSRSQSDTAGAYPRSHAREDPLVPQPPPDFPPPDWDREPPPEEPGVSDVLPKPASRWHGTDHLPGPEPCAPIWDSEPPDDDSHEIQHVCGQGTCAPTAGQADSDGTRVAVRPARLIDYLTTQGLKPVPPRVIMHVHLTDQTLLTGQGVVRSDDCGPLLLTQLNELLGRHHCSISLRPVLDPANLAAVDSYEIPQVLRDAVRTRHPASAFPFSSRTGKHLQLDHTIPHTLTSEPAGQTSITNLGPLAVPEHRPKTAGVWHVEQPHPGVFLWRSPYGHYFLVTNHGTQALGPKPGPCAPLPRPIKIAFDSTRQSSVAPSNSVQRRGGRPSR